MVWKLKTLYGDDLRRVTIANSAVPSYADLVSLMRSTYSIAPSQGISLRFADEDNDSVTMSNDAEVVDAFEFAASRAPTPLRVYVVRNEVPLSAASSAVFVDDSLSVASVRSSLHDLVREAVSDALSAKSGPKEGAVSDPDPEDLGDEDPPVVIPEAPPAPAPQPGTSSGPHETPKPATPPPPSDPVSAFARSLQSSFDPAALAGLGAAFGLPGAENAISGILNEVAQNGLTNLPVPPEVKAAAAAAARDEAAASTAASTAAAAAAASSPGSPSGSAREQERPQTPPVAAFPLYFGEGQDKGKDPADGERRASTSRGRSTPEPREPETAPNNVHLGVQCDGCGVNPIIGERFKCKECDDYDLCAVCEAAGTHSMHSFLKLPTRDTAVHHHVTCDGCSATPVVGTRFKCLNCDDYDLCETCYDAGKIHRELGHHFKAITSNRNAAGPWWARMAAAAAASANSGGPGPFGGFGFGPFGGPRPGVFGWRGGRGGRGGRGRSSRGRSRGRSHGRSSHGRCGGRRRGGWAAAWAQAHQGGAGGGDGLATATATAPASAPPAAEAVPEFQATFVADTNIPDGSEVAPGEAFSKGWRMANTGSAAWPEGTGLVFVGGELMSAPFAVPVAPVGAGETIDVSVPFKAPTEPGRYAGYWRLANPTTGHRFGDRVWLDVVVPAPAAPAPPARASTSGTRGRSSPAPPAPPAPVVNGAEALAQLSDMGFTDQTENERLLTKYGGRLDRVLDELMRGLSLSEKKSQ